MKNRKARVGPCLPLAVAIIVVLSSTGADAATVGSAQIGGVTTTALGWVYGIGVAAVIGLGLMYAFARETFEDLMGRFARIAIAVGLAFGAATIATALGLGAANGASLY